MAKKNPLINESGKPSEIDGSTHYIDGAIVKNHSNITGTYKYLDERGIYSDLDINATNGFNTSKTSVIADHITDIWIDPTTGVDGLAFKSYLGATISTGNRFLTAKAAFDWVNQYDGGYVRLYITGTSVGSPLDVSDELNVIDKLDFGIYGGQNSGAIAHIRFNTGGYVNIRKSLFSFTRCNLIVNQNDALWVGDYSTLRLPNFVTITLNAAISYGICVTGSCAKLDIGLNFTFNFSANNQLFIHPSANGGCTVMFSNHSTNNVWNTSTYTGLLWVEIGNSRTCITQFVANTPAPTIPSNINMSGTLLQFGSRLAIVQTVFDVDSYNYALSLGGTKPLKFLDLSSSSSNLAYTTKKKLIINELHEVGVMDDTGGGTPTIDLAYGNSIVIPDGTLSPFAATASSSGSFSKWTITGDVSSTVVVNVKKNGTNVFTTNKPTLTAQRSNSGTNMTGTTTSYTAGDILELEIENNDNAKYIALTLS